jgi:hypothetical protein
VRRILSRAGLVLGGVVVGTAAAWLLSAANASADTEPSVAPEILQPVVGTLTAPGDTKPTELPQYVDQIVHKTVPQPPAPPKELTDFGKQVQGAVDTVATHLARTAHHNDGTENAGSAANRMLALGDYDAPAVVHPVDVDPQTAPAVTGQARMTAHDFSRHPATESPRHEPLDAPAPVLPALPPLPAPLVPPTAPAGSCNSCGHGSDDDLGLPFVATWPNPQSGFATSRALRLITQHVATAVGEQPGVTPD